MMAHDIGQCNIDGCKILQSGKKGMQLSKSFGRGVRWELHLPHGLLICKFDKYRAAEVLGLQVAAHAYTIDRRTLLEELCNSLHEN